MKCKLRDVSFWFVNPRAAETSEVLVAVSETSDVSHHVSFRCCCKGSEVVRVPRGMWNETGAGAKRVSSNCQPNLFCAVLGRLGRTASQVCTNNFGAGADRGHGRSQLQIQSTFTVPEMPEACKTVSPAGRMQAWSLIVGGKLGSRDVGYPIPMVGTVGRTTSGHRRGEKTQREEFAMSSGERHS